VATGELTTTPVNAISAASLHQTDLFAVIALVFGPPEAAKRLIVFQGLHVVLNESDIWNGLQILKT